MWLSKKMSGKISQQRAEKGMVTLSDNSSWEAGSTVSARDLPKYAPYGYISSPPVGEEVIIVPSSDGQVALGVKQKNESLESGERCIVEVQAFY